MSLEAHVDNARIADAARALVRTWDCYTLADNAGHMTETEMVAFADLYSACGEGQSAVDLMECWIEAEIYDRECEPGDFKIEVVDGKVCLIDTRGNDEADVS